MLMNFSGAASVAMKKCDVTRLQSVGAAARTVKRAGGAGLRTKEAARHAIAADRTRHRRADHPAGLFSPGRNLKPFSRISSAQNWN